MSRTANGSCGVTNVGAASVGLEGATADGSGGTLRGGNALASQGIGGAEGALASQGIGGAEGVIKAVAVTLVATIDLKLRYVELVRVPYEGLMLVPAPPERSAPVVIVVVNNELVLVPAPPERPAP